MSPLKYYFAWGDGRELVTGYAGTRGQHWCRDRLLESADRMKTITGGVITMHSDDPDMNKLKVKHTPVGSAAKRAMEDLHGSSTQMLQLLLIRGRIYNSGLWM